MVQPFAFNQSEACVVRNPRRSRATGTQAVHDSNLPSSTPRVSYFRFDRRNRISRKACGGISTKKDYGQGGYPTLGGFRPKTSENSDDVDSWKSSLQEIALKGQEIFWFILREELSSREKAEPGCLRDLNIPPSKQREQILGSTIAGGSYTLRKMAQAFAKTSYRQSVQKLADSVDLTTLSFATFSDLLNGVFQEAEITRERILVLYYFCCDLALRAAYLHLSNQFRNLVHWISYFISNNLSVWVEQRGGWAAVLQDSSDYLVKLVLTGFCVVGIVTCLLFFSTRTK